MSSNTSMRLFEVTTLGLILGAIFPILGFLTGWWGTFRFLPEKFSVLACLLGLLLGVLVDVFYLKKWVSRAYDFDWKLWIAIYLFYAVGMWGLFMGFPVFNVLLALPAGLFVGFKLAHQSAGEAEQKRLSRDTCLFTTAVMAVACLATAYVALTDPYTAGSLEGMLGLPFTVTYPMLVGISLFGGAGLLVLSWLLTAVTIRLTLKRWAQNY